MKKLILRCGLAPGDIVMLTAAVRDLHRCYPRRFATDVRTVCPELWEHNPHITQLSEDEPGVEELECSYPLINRCNETPYHCLHGFIEFSSLKEAFAYIESQKERWKGKISQEELRRRAQSGEKTYFTAKVLAYLEKL